MAIEKKRPAGRVLSPAQKAEMLRKEGIVLRERIKGKSFYKIEQEYGFHNPDRIFQRAIAREENSGFRRAEAIRLEEMRLDDLQDGIWPQVLQGNPRAVEVALKVLERRARMLGLDFADMISGQLVEVEQAKVKIMATALVAALDATGLSADQRKTATAAFLAALRTSEQAEPEPILALAPEDEDLL